MPNQIDGKIKDERSKALIELSEKNEKNFIEKYVGRTMRVLLEQKVNEKDGSLEGYTRNYIKVKVEESNADMKRTIINCNIKEACSEYAIGSYIQEL
jgi:threonylcarbamoyladenosine tRNA methylthiotransferase MtaB